ncbi:Fatty acid hydroxylase vlmA [Pseudocercospora fuligena]|uniref:Fatty acid hydroxylase vlmA n=1 Tax=Pseudocercospora fuligena TaxID=685502 RepID=A0A8H6VSD1_9PEZI|nr:Fatty acid hydroxylase vlmA [Pseudocercospora fuligena]
MATITETASPAVQVPPMRNPKDSMKSTWRTKPRNEWTLHMWLCELLRMQPSDPKRETPIHQKTDKMPYLSPLACHKWVLVHALWPIAVQQLYFSYFGTNMHAIVAFLFYSIVFKINAIHEIAMLRDLGHRFGFLDGDKHARDEVPDIAVKKVFRSLSSTSTFRPLMVVFLAYRRSEAPSLSWWLPVEIGLYGIILDFWFYWYHRAMHDNDHLWKFHRTHHLTKHPNPLLTLYADAEQEIFDIAGIPLLTYFTMKLIGLPMGFYDLWICHQYVVFTELFGHSGLRLYTTPPSTASWVTDLVDAQLVTEDHDLHHRKGWKKSHNYGKQTRLWDQVFGTCIDRIETVDDNVDFANPVGLNLLWGN